jgi:hypothetical protein
LPIPKPVCGALGLHVFENEYHQWLPDIDLILIRAIFQLMIPQFTPVSLLESGAIVIQLADTRKRPLSHL